MGKKPRGSYKSGPAIELFVSTGKALVWLPEPHKKKDCGPDTVKQELRENDIGTPEFLETQGPGVIGGLHFERNFIVQTGK